MTKTEALKDSAWESWIKADKALDVAIEWRDKASDAHSKAYAAWVAAYDSGRNAVEELSAITAAQSELLNAQRAVELAVAVNETARALREFAKGVN